MGPEWETVSSLFVSFFFSPLSLLFFSRVFFLFLPLIFFLYYNNNNNNNNNLAAPHTSRCLYTCQIYSALLCFEIFSFEVVVHSRKSVNPIGFLISLWQTHCCGNKGKQWFIRHVEYVKRRKTSFERAQGRKHREMENHICVHAFSKADRELKLGRERRDLSPRGFITAMYHCDRLTFSNWRIHVYRYPRTLFYIYMHQPW